MGREGLLTPAEREFLSRNRDIYARPGIVTPPVIQPVIEETTQAIPVSVTPPENPELGDLWVQIN